MANVFSNPTYKSNIGFNEFPIRQHKQFSSTVGHLLPVYFDYLKPGDKVSCGCNIKTRLQPMVTPAFCKIEEHVDWFFVPLKQIFEPVVDILYGIQDFSSDVFDGSSNKSFPLFTGTLIKDFVYNALVDGSGEHEIGKALSADDAVIFRCLDFLGFPVKSLGAYAQNILTDGASEVADLPSLPVWFAGAYQKIWSDHYRLTDWQENNAWLYNFDSFQTGTAITSTRFKSCFTLHRASFKRDYNTYVLPSPVFGTGDYNAFGNPVANINQWLTTLVGSNTIDAYGSASTVGSTQVYETKSGANGVNPAQNVIRGDFNPANIRTLFAAEKFLEITRRAGKHYDKQVLAHYGINVPTGIDGESFFLGGQTQDVLVTDVFATAETEYSVEGNSEGTPLGKMAGKAFGNVQGGNINFTAKCEGILMAIYYAIPDVVYENTGYDPLNRLVRPQDFYNPQFDDLGMQPSFMAYRSILVDNDGWEYASPSSFGSWQWRYMELKSKPNIALGAFVGSMDKWTLSRVCPGGGTWNDFVVPSDFLNPIMVAQYSDASPVSYINNFFNEDNDALTAGKYLVSAIYDRDPMLHDAVFFCNKVSKMSKFGIGSL